MSAGSHTPYICGLFFIDFSNTCSTSCLIMRSSATHVNMVSGDPTLCVANVVCCKNQQRKLKFPVVCSNCPVRGLCEWGRQVGLRFPSPKVTQTPLFTFLFTPYTRPACVIKKHSSCETPSYILS